MRAASLCLAERSIANPFEGLRARIPNVGAQACAWSPVCRVSGRPFGLQQAAQTMLGERAFAGAKQCYSRAPLLQRHTKTVSAASLRTPTHRLAHRLIQTSIHVTGQRQTLRWSPYGRCSHNSHEHLRDPEECLPREGPEAQRTG